MKVTFCTRNYGTLSGGHNTWLCRVLPYLRHRGVESRVLCFTSSSDEACPTVHSLRETGFACTVLSEEEKKYTEEQLRWVIERLLEDPPDVFVLNAVIPAAYYAARWVRDAGIPTVGICHIGASHILYPGLVDEFVFGSADYQVSTLVCVSKYLERGVLERRPEKILVRNIPCGVAIPEAVAENANGRLRLAYVGRLAEVGKRISEVTHALCRVVREIPGTEALIFGDGPARPVVEQILRQEGAGLPVHLVGFVENDQIQKRLLECHVLVLLSDWEGLPVSVMEGMACGLVSIGLRGAPGVTELIVDDVTGLLVGDRGDEFVAAVRRLREDPALWRRLAASARAEAKAEHSLEACAARWQNLFEEAVNKGGPRKPLRVPWRPNLPPVHPALADLDNRVPPPREQFLRFGRRVVTRLRFQYPSIFGSQ